MEQISKIPPPQYDQGISAPKTDVMPVSLQGNILTNLLYRKNSPYGSRNRASRMKTSYPNH